jgi:hypothetical protein
MESTVKALLAPGKGILAAKAAPAALHHRAKCNGFALQRQIFRPDGKQED